MKQAWEKKQSLRIWLRQTHIQGETYCNVMFESVPPAFLSDHKAMESSPVLRNRECSAVTHEIPPCKLVPSALVFRTSTPTMCISLKGPSTQMPHLVWRIQTFCTRVPSSKVPPTALTSQVSHRLMTNPSIERSRIAARLVPPPSLSAGTATTGAN